ncbi:hypothetical protein KSP40_PGU000691 [Platanthera guangdongensis]|uniref:Uncharacterized protein n=1 Tax=Platanthera guangdongensis TaxID=2320717 RepID=A0ABR2MA41_9ASPA
MAYGYGRRDPSVFDALTASPLPYPVLFIHLTVFLLLFVFGFFNYEDMLESAEEQMSEWCVLQVLVFAVWKLGWRKNLDTWVLEKRRSMDGRGAGGGGVYLEEACEGTRKEEACSETRNEKPHAGERKGITWRERVRKRRMQKRARRA